MTLLYLGLIGFTAVLIANLVSLARGQEAAVFFSEAWWTPWFTNYLVWIIFTVVGALQRYRFR